MPATTLSRAAHLCALESYSRGIPLTLYLPRGHIVTTLGFALTFTEFSCFQKNSPPIIELWSDMKLMVRIRNIIVGTHEVGRIVPSLSLSPRFPLTIRLFEGFAKCPSSRNSAGDFWSLASRYQRTPIRKFPAPSWKLAVEGDEGECSSEIIAFAGREMACADSFDTGSGDPIQSHALESEVLCACRNTPTCRLGWTLFFQARRRRMVCVPA